MSLKDHKTALIGLPDLLQIDGVTIAMDTEEAAWPAANLVDQSIHKPARTAMGATSAVINIDLGQAYPVNVIGLINGNWSPSASVSVVGSAVPMPARVRVAPKTLANMGSIGAVGSISEPLDTPDGSALIMPQGSRAQIGFGTPVPDPSPDVSQLYRVLARSLAPGATLTMEADAPEAGVVSQVTHRLSSDWEIYVLEFVAGETPVLNLEAITNSLDSVDIEAAELLVYPQLPNYVSARWRQPLTSGPGGIPLDLMQALPRLTAELALDQHHSYQYWQIEVHDSSNADGYIQIGRAWLSPAIAEAHLLGNTSIGSESIGGERALSARAVMWIDPPAAVRRRVDLELRGTADVGIRQLFGGAALTGALDQPFLLSMHPDGLPDDQGVMGFLAVSDGDGELELLADRRGLPTSNTIRVVEVT